MEDAYRIHDYLPVSYKSQTEQEYMKYLWEAYEFNYGQGKYQFALLAYHMLYMSFIYFNLWQIKSLCPNDFAKALIGFDKEMEKKIIQATSPFTFSQLKEKSIFRFLKLVECNNQQIGDYSSCVNDRNDYAHPNGNIFCRNQREADAKVTNLLNHAQSIQGNIKDNIQLAYQRFLSESAGPEERQYAESEDQIREVLIHENYLSLLDISYCLEYDIGQLSDHEHFGEIRKLHEEFGELYAEEMSV